jgi:TRAP-type mannitol/chloroaromatic compound transport system permease small subunit
MRTLLRFCAAVDRANDALARWVSWACVLMVVIGALNAALRYADRWAGGGLSSNAYLEAQWYLFSLVFLLGAPHALRANVHVRVDVLYARLSERARAWIDLVGGVLFLLPFCAFAIVVAWPTVLESWSIAEGSPDPGGLPRYPIKTAVLVSFVLLLLQGLSETIKRVATLRGIPIGEPDPAASPTDGSTGL